MEVLSAVPNEGQAMTWEDFEAEALKQSGARVGKCGVAMLLAGLSEDAQLKISSALGNPRLSNSAIAAVLRKRVGDAAPRQFTVARHRRGDCSCP
jgi:hypothetical protein